VDSSGPISVFNSYIYIQTIDKKVVMLDLWYRV